ncbi:hypothetical protein N7475_010148 [Penicillium sp. IBT 31633x]|nr:hypothetical protein N7475_010148 [Penicillium sp. IBT 31633x]
MPIAFGEKFHFDAQQIGLQFIAVITGCVLGEQRNVVPSGSSMAILYCLCHGICRSFDLGIPAPECDDVECYSLFGITIASFGNQMQTTILTTFAVESKQERASQVGVFVNLGPFYFPNMFTALGLGGAACVMAAIVAGCAFLPVIAVQIVSTRAARD